MSSVHRLCPLTALVVAAARDGRRAILPLSWRASLVVDLDPRGRCRSRAARSPSCRARTATRGPAARSPARSPRPATFARRVTVVVTCSRSRSRCRPWSRGRRAHRMRLRQPHPPPCSPDKQRDRAPRCVRIERTSTPAPARSPCRFAAVVCSDDRGVAAVVVVTVVGFVRRRRRCRRRRRRRRCGGVCQGRGARWAVAEYAAGDALLFDLRLVHASTRNRAGAGARPPRASLDGYTVVREWFEGTGRSSRRDAHRASRLAPRRASRLAAPRASPRTSPRLAAPRASRDASFSLDPF